MSEFQSEWVESGFPLIAAAGMKSVYGTSNLPIYLINEPYTALLALASGRGSLSVDGEARELSQGDMALIPSGLEASLTADRLQPFHVYVLLLTAPQATHGDKRQAAMRKSELLSGEHIEILPSEPAIMAKLEELYVHRVPTQEWRHLRNQISLQEIMLYVLERLKRQGEQAEQPSMERSIVHLENYFHNKVSRDDLAAIAGVSRSHYSSMFKQLTGYSPSEYLTRIRVNRAIELLIEDAGTLREIAHRVGYRDEFYLSRRFKQHTGVSPTAFDQGPAPRVAVWLIPYASHMLLLGVKPVVTIAENSEYVNASGKEEAESPEGMIFADIDSSPEQIKSSLRRNRIELVIAAREHLQYMELSASQLRPYAPVVEVSWMELGWREHLRLIARAIGRSGEAERWLAAFDEEEEAARLQVQQLEAAQDSYAVFVLKPGELLVYGARNIGYVIYQSLGLRPPARIKAEIEQQQDRFHSVQIQPEELADYEGDRLLVVIYPDERGSTAHAETLFQSQEWNALAAVRGGHVHYLERDEWVPYNPVSIQLQLKRAVALLAEASKRQ
ncbi:helix-turn-helix domain-containing protein [Paenibacillus pinisoli]|uniref:Helix-turn-helix domain-containing protein n=1 Tax=Paenibacillus pinisoli TaxID=1276110 RepID=A0A3A6Q7B1_9BACL|nr:helix-turn-helix domain-containing protein [Paenibacillus pinisoli]RJX41734.1 helix-turn-helix domain-containing protein [Paenibacillus pinisoli]